MSKVELLEELIAIFRATAEAHHQAFIETGGVDPEWASWYAGHMEARLNGALRVRLTHEQIVDLLLRADTDHQHVAPGRDWAIFYAEYFLSEVSE